MSPARRLADAERRERHRVAGRDRGERSPELRPRVPLRGVTAAPVSARTRGSTRRPREHPVRRTLIAITPITLLVPLLGVVGGVLGGGGAGAAAPCESDAPPTYAGEVPTGDEVESIGSRSAARRPPLPRSRTTSTRWTRPATTSGSAPSAPRSRAGRSPTPWWELPQTWRPRGAPPASCGTRTRRRRTPPRSPRPARRSSGWPATCTAARRAAATRPCFVLHELADRTDCAATSIRDNTVTVIIPTQNPDGREARHPPQHLRLRPQPRLVRPHPAGDRRQAGAAAQVPARADDRQPRDGRRAATSSRRTPTRSTTRSPTSRSTWINDLYGGAMAATSSTSDGVAVLQLRRLRPALHGVRRQRADDRLPRRASMTYEKGASRRSSNGRTSSTSPPGRRCSRCASRKTTILRGLAANYREAYREGAGGELEPNEVFAPGSTLELQVPDETVRHYFMRGDRLQGRRGPRPGPETAAHGRRVRRLTAPLRVPGYKRYGEPRSTRVLPKGTFWVPMAQPQKHWIQAMLGEDSLRAVPVLLRRDRLERAAAVQRPGRSHRRHAAAQVRSGAVDARAGCTPAPPLRGRRCG